MALILAIPALAQGPDTPLRNRVEERVGQGEGVPQARTMEEAPLISPAEVDARRAEMEKRRQELEAEATKKREEIRLQAEERRAQVETRMEEVRARKAEFQQEIAVRRVENTSRIMLATIDRLSGIADRVASRTLSLRTRGADTSESEGYMNSARADLSAARDSARALTALDLSGETAQENFEKIRVAAAEAREHIRSAHTNLMQATRSLATLEASLRTAGESSEESEN